MDFDSELGLHEIISALQVASSDNRIKAIYLDISPSFGAGYSTLKELHHALLACRDSGKKIIAYSTMLMESGYYIASTANEIHLNPSGTLLLKGLYSERIFFGEALKRLGIEVQVFKHGTFKSAVEPFISTEMSPANRLQVEGYLESIYGTFLSDVAPLRNMDTDSLRRISNGLLVRSPGDGVKYGLIDRLSHDYEIRNRLRELAEISDPDKEVSMLTLKEYFQSNPPKKSSKQDRIAVLYANGDIQDEGEGDDIVSAERMIKAIREIGKDKKVKALVLRINSPGGGALASDRIYHELMLLKKKMPIIVSMGDVAASGGYFIAAAGDTIVAQPNTITGSIGVFGLYPNMQGLLNDKLGIYFDGVKTGEFSSIGRVDKPMTPAEKAIIQQYIEDVYSSFTGIVNQSRGIPLTAMDSIAEGRVWAGADAIKIGLVDVLGGIETAMNLAKERAQLDEYRVVRYPKLKNPLEFIFKSKKEAFASYWLKKEFGAMYPLIKDYRNAEKLIGIQMRLPYLIQFN
jgi:protease-4